jgi:hypothetical protein
MRTFALFVLLIVTAVAFAQDAQPAAAPAGRTFYVDPAQGKAENDGSAAKPWRTLDEVIKKGLIRGRSAEGKESRTDAPVGPGDTILLRTGHHGEIRISGAYNTQTITVAAEKDQKPVISRLDVHDAARWVFRGLTITPEGAAPYRGDMAMLAERGPGEELVLEDCLLCSTRDTSAWTAKDWMEKAQSGILLGRHGTRLTARNNHVLNTRFGINLCSPDSLCEGNIVENFSGDGIRITRDNITVQYNVIKNIHVSDADGDKNHDDGIQCFLFNKGTGTVRKATVRGNLIINREDEKQRFPASMQGLGFFDGPLVDFLVEGNVVIVDHWHGISLYDAQNCVIRDNAVNTKWPGSRMRPWIMLGTKKKEARGNRVSNNIAHAFNFKADASVAAENNRPVTDEEFNRKRQELETVLAEKFGKQHPVSGAARVQAAGAKPGTGH